MVERIYSDDTEGNAHRDMEKVYNWSQGDMDTVRLVQGFHSQQDAQLILTNTDFQIAKRNVAKIADRIKGKAVVEIGAGVGFAALEVAKYAYEVVAIESDPMWNWVFCQHLYKLKPEHLTWIFGDAQRIKAWVRLYTFDEILPFDVAVIFTRSGIKQLREIGRQFANEVIMFHQEYPDESYIDIPRT